MPVACANRSQYGIATIRFWNARLRHFKESGRRWLSKSSHKKSEWTVAAFHSGFSTCTPTNQENISHLSLLLTPTMWVFPHRAPAPPARCRSVSWALSSFWRSSFKVSLFKARMAPRRRGAPGKGKPTLLGPTGDHHPTVR